MRLSLRIPASVVLLAATVPLCGGLTGCSLFQPNGQALAMGDLPGLQEIGLHNPWQRPIRLEHGERITKAWYLVTSIYLATSESRIIRLDAKTGVVKWTQGLGRENFEIFRPIELKNVDGSSANQVLVVTRGEAFVFHKETGDEVCLPARLNISVSADPVVIGNNLCVGGADTFYGMYLDRLGSKHWRIPVPGDLFVSSPVALDNNLLIASKNGRLCRINGEDGDWDWKDRKTNGDVLGGLAADYNAVYVPCLDQRVYAFRTDSGGELWEQQLEGRLEYAPVLAGPLLLVRSYEGRLFALNRADGAIKWQLANIGQIATVNDDGVWLADRAGNLRLVSLKSSRDLESAPVPNLSMLVPNSLDNKLILISRAGVVGLYTPAAERPKTDED
jgi:hypothetical protein